MKKPRKIIKIILISFLTLALLITLIYLFWPWNRSFFKISEQEFSIPALVDGFAPQGFVKIDGQNKYLISGYMSDGSPSRFYVINSENGEVEKYFTLVVDQKKYNEHAGGVASYGKNLWTVSDGFCFNFSLKDVNSIADGGEIKVKEKFETFNRADYVFVNNEILWVGEFYREQNYLTDENHHLETRSGEINPALIYGFRLEKSIEYGIRNHNPVKAISTRNLVQGIEMTDDGYFVMSTSYGLADSNLFFYKNVLNEDNHSTIELGEYTLPLWFLDDEALISDLVAPSMAEEVVVKDDRVLILFESGCKKYYYNRVRLKDVYSVPLDFFEKAEK